MLDELRQIAIFAKTVDHGSFRGAAQALRLSPSVVSHHIAQLEEKLGVALIYRSTRRLALTREGEQFLKSAHAMVKAVETGLSGLHNKVESPSGQVTITLPSLLSGSELMTLIAELRVIYPKVRIELKFTDEKRNLIKDGYDLAISMSSKRRRASNRLSLFSSRRCIVASDVYLLQRRPISSPTDLEGHDWIEFAPTRYIPPSRIRQGSQEFSLLMRGNLSVNDAVALRNLAKKGAGLALVPEFLVVDDLAEGLLRPILADWEIEPLDVYAEWPANSPKTSLARLLAVGLKNKTGTLSQPSLDQSDITA